MIAVVALVLDRETRVRVRDALSGRASVHFCQRADEVFSGVREHQAAAAVVELRDIDRTLTAPLIKRLRGEFPLTPVIGYAAVSHATATDILAAAHAGVNALVIRGLDDIGVALRSAIASGEDDVTARRAMAGLDDLVPASVKPIVEHCLQHARHAPTVASLGTALGLHRKTLMNRLTAAGLPAPHQLIGWCRLLLAARLLEDVGRPLEQVALALGFPTAPSLRNMLKRYTGLQAREVRQRGGFDCVLDCLRRAIVAERATAALTDH